MQSGGEFTLMRDRDRWMLSRFFALSLLVHGIGGAAFSQLRGTATLPPPPLEVTLERPEPPITPPVPLPLAPPTPRVTPPAEKPKPQVQKKIAPAPLERVAPPPVLSLPQTASASEVTVPAPRTEEKPPEAVREEKPVQAAPPVIAPRPPPEATASVTTTLPSFDAAYLHNPQPRYPMSARRRGEQGTVTLKVLVTREGTAATVSVDTSSGSTSLDDAALEAVRKWRFVPAKRGGAPVEAWHLVPIVFRLEGMS